MVTDLCKNRAARGAISGTLSALTSIDTLHITYKTPPLNLLLVFTTRIYDTYLSIMSLTFFPIPCLPLYFQRLEVKMGTNFYTPSLFVILRGLKVAERSYLGLYGEVFSSASISDVQEGGFAIVASE
jgi:hypothetical protein